MNQESEKKLQYIGNSIGAVIGLAIAFFLIKTWFSEIDINNEYGLAKGFLHGGWAPFKWILSFFQEGIILKAPLHTGAYTFFWWFSFICAIYIIFIVFLRIIISIRLLFTDWS